MNCHLHTQTFMITRWHRTINLLFPTTSNQFTFILCPLFIYTVVRADFSSFAGYQVTYITTTWAQNTQSMHNSTTQ